MMTPLNDTERASPLLHKLIEGWREELATLRARNDNPALSRKDTQALRGRIAQLKAHIALGDEPPVIDAPN